VKLDFDILQGIYGQYVKPYVDDNDKGLVEEIKSLGEKIKLELGLNWAYFDKDQSEYILDLYSESISLGQTYYNKSPIWKNFS